MAACIGFWILVFRSSKQTAVRIWLAASAVFLSLLGAEVSLRAAGINRAYIEGRIGKYMSAFIRYDNNIHRTYGSNTESYLHTTEYNYLRHHNNFGFSDADFFPKKDSEILIQTYGDSYTEGDGAPFDSSYPALLRTLLRNYDNIIIQNFGICGSDPAFYWKQLQDIGLSLRPDAAVITYDTGDFTTDFLTRGGLERFKGDHWEATAPPSWEWLYASSYLFRLIAVSVFHISDKDFFFTSQAKIQRLKELEPRWNETFLKIADLARKNNIQVLLVKKPGRGEVELNRYDYDFTFFEKIADTIPEFRRIDLLTYYRDSAHVSKENSKIYYWEKDGHHNSNGYALMARGIYAGLKKYYPELFFYVPSGRNLPNVSFE